MEIRQDIQFLRGLAVLTVVLFHLQVPFFQNGFLGVDIFFVISGFLMAKLYDKGTIIDFYKRRLDRLYPAYSLTLLVTLVVGAVITIPVDFNQLFEQSIAGSLFLSNVYYWNQNSYFDKAAFNPLLNLWSLAVEVQFYLLVPFLYPLLRRKKWLFILVFCVSLASCFAIQTISQKTSFFQMPFRIWEFLIGAYVAWWSNTNVASSLKLRIYSLFCFVALTLSLFALKLKPDAVGTIFYGHPALPALTVTLLTGFIIRYGIDTKIIGGLIGRLFVKLGDYSYSIYLVHFPIIVLLNYLPFGGTRLTVDGYVDLVFTLILIAFTSTVSYVFLEKKFSFRLNSIKARLSIFIAIFLSAFSLFAFNSSQFSLIERNIFSAWTDRDIYRCGKIFRIFNPFDIVCNVGGAKEGKGILLIGNSHADAIKRVFADKAVEYGIATFFVVAHGPLLGSGPSAEQFIDIAVKRDIKTLVLHYSNSYGKEKFRTEVAKLIDIAKSKGIKVLIIAPVPTYDVHIPQAMFNNSDNKEALFMTREQHLDQNKTFREFVASFENSGVEIYDPSEFLCNSEAGCIVSTVDSKPYYYDSHHLTLTGASLLKPLFDRLLSRIY
jgi:peptidoglycan/LPS O-acetylase OafA/YrhL